MLEESYDRLQWGRGLIEEPLDIRSLYYAIESKGSKNTVLKKIEDLREGESEKIKKYIEGITRYFFQVINIAEKYM